MSATKSLREQILEINDIKSENIKIPEWNDLEVQVKSITAGQRSAMIEKCMNKKGDIDTTGLQYYSIIEGACDPSTGERLFTDADISQLKKKSSSALNTISEAFNEINGFGEAEVSSMEKN